MKILYTLALTVIMTWAHAQDKVISGRLTDDTGSPLPGVNVLIKGTTIGTTTDADGRYTITAPVGSTLIFAFVGMTTREVVVTADGARAPKPKPVVKVPAPQTTPQLRKVPRITQSFITNDSIPKDIPGVAVLTPETPSYKGSIPENGKSIRSIQRVGNLYIITRQAPSVTTAMLHAELSTAFGMDRITQLPELQTAYAQGRPVNGTTTWRGPDQQEVFSWGPLLRTLEFDGTAFNYDRNGKLVPAGTGAGIAAREYNTKEFFRTGFTNSTEIKLSRRTRHNAEFQFMAENRLRTGVLPGTRYDRTNFVLTGKSIQLRKNLTLGVSAQYNRSGGTLLPRGANTASLLGSILRTPVTFDNADGLSRRVALNDSRSYLLADRSMRSHAPGLADNPFALAGMLPDREQMKRGIGSVDINYYHNSFSLTAVSAFDDQRSESKFGTPHGFSGNVAGRLTQRDDHQKMITASLTPTYRFQKEQSELKLSATYKSSITDRRVKRYDYFDFTADEPLQPDAANSTAYKERSLLRSTNEIFLNGLFSYDEKFSLRLSNRAYFSNTIDAATYTNFFPAAGLKIHVSQLFYYGLEPNIDIFASAARGIHEAPLLYTDWSYAASLTPMAQYSTVYEAGELTYSRSLRPETEEKFEAGMSVDYRTARLEFSYYNNTTNDFVVPAANPLNPAMINAGTVRNTGLLTRLSWNSYNYGQITWGASAGFEVYDNKVVSLHDEESMLPLAGFAEVRTGLAPGQPFGAIYGTSWLRDDAGNRIIGADGFPMVDQRIKMIGNPIPDYKLSGTAYFQYRGFKFASVFEYKKGGEVYNGTRAALDYLGRSAETGSQRQVANYIFEGVTEPGNINTTAVNFADPNRDVSENRWTRYGFAGVGEEYIEDASWFRLSELSVAYQFRTTPTARIHNITLAFIGQNVLLITPYTGVDPASKLFNYANGTGIDLFNQPSARSYSFQITLKI